MKKTICWLILFIIFAIGTIISTNGAMFAGTNAGLLCSLVLLLRSLYINEDL